MIPFLLLAACSPVRLTDTTRLSLDLLDPDELASPYVVGAAFDLVLDTPSNNPNGWTLTSSDPDVLTLGVGSADLDDEGDASAVRFPTLAKGVGEATLIARAPNGDEVLTTAVRVAAPTRLELRSATDLELDTNAAALDVPKVLTGGTASFRVDFFDGSDALAGAGGLEVSPRGGAVIEDQSTLFEDTDWIVVTPSASGTLTLDVSTGGVDAGVVEIESVPSSSLAGITVEADSERGAADDQPLRVIAVAVDTVGDRVYGGVYTWAEDGDVIDTSGDIYRYNFDEAVTTRLTVTTPEASEALTIHGRGGSVSDTSSVACAVANVGPVGLAVLLAAMGAVRRRRATPQV